MYESDGFIVEDSARSHRQSTRLNCEVRMVCTTFCMFQPVEFSLRQKIENHKTIHRENEMKFTRKIYV